MPRRSDDEDDEGSGHGTTQPMSPLRRDRESSRHRAVTPTDIEEIARAQAEAQMRAQASVERGRQIRTMELVMVEWFGRDGDGGKLAALEATVRNHDLAIDELKTFKVKLVVYGSVLVTVGGVLAAIAFKLIEKLF